MTTRYIETIRLENGLFHLLDLHQQRLTATVREIYGEEIIVPDIKTALSAIADIPVDGIYKCRIVYDTEISEIEFQPYTRRTGQRGEYYSLYTHQYRREATQAALE